MKPDLNLIPEILYALAVVLFGLSLLGLGKLKLISI